MGFMDMFAKKKDPKDLVREWQSKMRSEDARGGQADSRCALEAVPLASGCFSFIPLVPPRHVS